MTPLEERKSNLEDQKLDLEKTLRELQQKQLNLTLADVKKSFKLSLIVFSCFVPGAKLTK